MSTKMRLAALLEDAQPNHKSPKRRVKEGRLENNLHAWLPKGAAEIARRLYGLTIDDNLDEAATICAALQGDDLLKYLSACSEYVASVFQPLWHLQPMPPKEFERRLNLIVAEDEDFARRFVLYQGQWLAAHAVTDGTGAGSREAPAVQPVPSPTNYEQTFHSAIVGAAVSGPGGQAHGTVNIYAQNFLMGTPTGSATASGVGFSVLKPEDVKFEVPAYLAESVRRIASDIDKALQANNGVTMKHIDDWSHNRDTVRAIHQIYREAGWDVEVVPHQGGHDGVCRPSQTDTGHYHVHIRKRDPR